MKSEIGRFSRSTASKNSRVSVRMASFSSAFHSGNFFASGLTASRLRVSSHWPAKLSAKAADFGSAIIRFTCASRTAGRCSWLASPSREQLVVRHRAPQEVAEPRRQFEIGDAAATAGPGIALDAEQELRRDQHRGDRELQALRRRVAARPCACRRCAVSRATSAFVDRTPVGAARERGEDPVHAGGAGRRIADRAPSSATACGSAGGNGPATSMDSGIDVAVGVAARLRRNRLQRLVVRRTRRGRCARRR